MGKCLITVLVVGSHHAGNADDIERLAARFAADLKAAGHSIERADMQIMAEVDLQNVEPTPPSPVPVPGPLDAAGLGHDPDSYPPTGYAPRSNLFVAADTSTWPAIWPAPVAQDPAVVDQPPPATV